jgi:hypothetical protein
MKTGPVRDAQQMKHCVYNIPCECRWCYIEEQADLWKYALRSTNITWPKDCLKNQKIKTSPTCIWRRRQNMLERSEGLADWTRHCLQEIQGIRLHVSGRSSDKSTQPGNFSHYLSRSQKTTTPPSVDYVWNLCFYLGTIQRICLFSDEFYSDSSLTLTTINMKQGMDISCVWSFLMFFVCLNSRRWFMLCLVYISYLMSVLVSGDRDYLYRLGPTK